MNAILIITTLIAISMGFSYLNTWWIKLPGVIGVMALSIITTRFIIPRIQQIDPGAVNSVDFSKTLLYVMPGFLLFASSLHFDVNKLKENLREVLCHLSIVWCLVR